MLDSLSEAQVPVDLNGRKPDPRVSIDPYGLTPWVPGMDAEPLAERHTLARARYFGHSWSSGDRVRFTFWHWDPDCRVEALDGDVIPPPKGKRANRLRYELNGVERVELISKLSAENVITTLPRVGQDLEDWADEELALVSRCVMQYLFETAYKVSPAEVQGVAVGHEFSTDSGGTVSLYCSKRSVQDAGKVAWQLKPQWPWVADTSLMLGYPNFSKMWPVMDDPFDVEHLPHRSQAPSRGSLALVDLTEAISI